MAFWQKTPVTWAAVFTFVRAAAPKQTAHGGRATRTKRATRQESRGPNRTTEPTKQQPHNQRSPAMGEDETPSHSHG